MSLFSPDTVFENEQFTIKNTSSGYSGNAVFTLSISDLIGAYAEKDTTLLFNLFQGDSIQYKYDKIGIYTIYISDGVDTIQKTINVKAIITLPCSTYCAQFNYQNCENICNGSFEDFTQIPNDFYGRVNYACIWRSAFKNLIQNDPTSRVHFGSADLFTSQSGSTACGVPVSAVGYQAAYIGSAYAGIITEGGSSSSCIYREYFHQKLNQPLIGGMTYTVKAYVSLAEGAKKATPIQIALFDEFNLTNFTPNSGSCSNVTISSSLIKASSTTIIDKAAWTEVSGTFTASTTNPEQYILIGLFNSPNYVGTSVTQSPGYGTNLQAAVTNSSYYFIDAVSITPVFCCPADVSYGTSETFTMNSSQLNLSGGQSMAFYGTLTLNTNLTLNNNHIKFGENSKIVVPSGRTLTIDNFSLLETCGNYLWKGIEVQPGGSIVVKQGTTIKDALTAVTLNGICNAQFENSFYQNNVKHIGVNNVSSGTHPAQIFGNIFSCSGLKGTYAGSITQAAIELNNVNFIKIGNTQGLGFQNVYSGALIGIKAISSGFEMYNNRFMNIGCISNTPPSTACGIGINSNYAVFVKNTGLASPKNVFIGNILCPSGQYCNNTFINGDGGIFANGVMNFYAANNTFQNYKEKGITVRNNGCTDCKTIISNNLFSTTGSVNSPGAVEVLEYNRARVSVSNNIINRSQAKNDSKGIFISNSTVPASGQLVKTNSNQISKFDFGIYILNANYPEAIENQITTDDASSWFYPEGIRVDNSQKAYIKNNSITELAPNKMGMGIRVESTPSAGVYCNNITDARIAMFYGGFNYTSTVAANYMFTCKNGFYVNWGQIGLQGPGKWSYMNAWIGDIGDWDSHFLVYGTNNLAFDGNLSRLNLKVPGSIYYPGGLLFKTIAQGPNSNPILNANKMTPVLTTGSITDPNEVPTFVTQCRDLNKDIEIYRPRMEEIISEMDSTENESDSSSYKSASTQTAKLYLLRALDEDSLGTINTALGDTIINYLQNSSTGKFFDYAKKISNNDSSVSSASISNVEINNEADSVYKNTLTLFRELRSNASDFDSSQIDVVLNLAKLCPYRYGEAVYLARGIYYNWYPDSLIMNECEMSYLGFEEKKQKIYSTPNKLDDIVIYPNPTNDYLNIVFLNNKGQNKTVLEIYDQTGKQVLNKSIKNNIENLIQLDLQDLKSGLYILKIIDANSEISTFKIEKQ